MSNCLVKSRSAKKWDGRGAQISENGTCALTWRACVCHKLASTPRWDPIQKKLPKTPTPKSKSKYRFKTDRCPGGSCAHTGGLVLGSRSTIAVPVWARAVQTVRPTPLRGEKGRGGER